MAALPFRYNAVAPGGAAASGAKLNVYAKSTTTPAVWYTDSGLTTPAANPLVADADGRWSAYTDSAVNYTVSGTTSDGATIIFQADITAGVITVDYEISSLYHQDWTPMLTKATAFADIASATTTDIGAASSNSLRVTGTTTITGLGTADAGVRRTLRFAAALTLTHNATSLILPGSANITTAANDTAEFVSLGSGNWLCVSYIRASGLPISTSVTKDVPTYAALTALTATTGLADNGVYYTYARATEEDGGAGNWRYDAASTATANGGTILAIDGGGAGRFFRLYTKGRIDVSWFGLTQGSTSGSVPADNVTAITAAMAQCNTDGGGEVILPPTGTSYIAINATIDNTYSNVLVKGAGRGFNHDVGANVARGGTRIRATAAITMARHRTVSGSASTPREDAGGFVDITFDSGGSATRILHVTSRYDGIYRFFFVNCEGTEAVLFDSLVTSSTLGEAADNQNFELDVVGRLIDSTASDACIGVVFDGASNANSSISAKRISIDIIHTNGDAVWFKNADNMLVNMLRSISVGTGRPFLVSGTRASNATYTEALHIDLYTGTNASYVEGTDTGGVTTAGRIIIDRLDDANGTPLPTGGTGALIVRRNSKGNAAGYAFEKLVAGEAQSSVIAGKAAIGASNSLMVYNTSEAHTVLSDGTNVWLIRIQSGDLNFSRSAGSGKLNLPADTNILINTAQLSLGAADSGGAGFKLLRVPN